MGCSHCAPVALSFFTAVVLLTAALEPAQCAPVPVRREVRAGGALIAVVPASPAGDTVPSSVVLDASVSARSDRASWRLQQTVDKVLKAVSFADPLNGYAAAELGAVYRTTNGGVTWTRVMNLGFPYYWYGVHAFSARTAIIAGFNNQTGAGVARWTDDGGVTWTPDLVIDPSNWLLGLSFADAVHGIAYGYQGYVYVTQNGGRTAADWTRVRADATAGWFAGNFTVRPDGRAWIAGISFCASTDGGMTWSRRASIDPVFDGGVSFSDPLHGWTGGGQISTPVSGWVHRTTDGGASWSGRVLQPAYPVRVVRLFDDRFGFAAGGNIYSSAGGIWSTADGGTTWNLDRDTGAEMAAMAAQPVSADSMDVWCVGFLPSYQGVIYKTRVERREPASVGADITSFSSQPRAVPNPFLARTEVSLRARLAIVYDAAGRRVRALAPLDGGGRFLWDGRDDEGRAAAPGVYLIRAADGDGPGARVVRIR